MTTETVPLATKHPDPLLRTQDLPGRPRVDPTERQRGNPPVIPSGSQPFDSKAIVTASRQAAAYHEVPRLRRTFWAGPPRINVGSPPVRSSSVRQFRRCKRAFMFHDRLGLIPRGAYSSALFIGRVFHALLEAFYQGGAVANFGTMTARRIDGALNRIKKDADPSGLLPDGRAFIEVAEEVRKDAQLACAMAVELAYRIPREQLLNAHDIVSVEQVYSVRIPGISAPLVVQPDLVLRHRATGALWIPDHKTTSHSPSMRAMSLPFEFQPRYYKYVVWAWHQARGEPVTIGGCLHNIIRKPTIHVNKRRGEVFEQYIQRVHEWYDEKNRLNPTDPPISISSVPHVGPILTEDLLATIHQVALASRARLDLARFTDNDQACLDWNRACPYLPLCRAAAMNRVRDWPTIIRRDSRQDFRRIDDR